MSRLDCTALRVKYTWLFYFVVTDARACPHVNLLHPVCQTTGSVELVVCDDVTLPSHHMFVFGSLDELGTSRIWPSWKPQKKRHGRHRMLLHCYTDVYRWSTLKYANHTRSRTNLSESSQWTVTLSMRCGHVQFRRKLWRTPSFWGQVCLESIMSRANKSNCVSSCVERKLPLSPAISHAEVTSSASATYRMFIMDGCHMFPLTWSLFSWQANETVGQAPEASTNGTAGTAFVHMQGLN